MIIFDNTSADFVLISADVILKRIIILKELRIAQLRSKNQRTLAIQGFATVPAKNEGQSPPLNPGSAVLLL